MDEIFDLRQTQKPVYFLRTAHDWQQDFIDEDVEYVFADEGDDAVEI